MLPPVPVQTPNSSVKPINIPYYYKSPSQPVISPQLQNQITPLLFEIIKGNMIYHIIWMEIEFSYQQYNLH